MHVLKSCWGKDVASLVQSLGPGTVLAREAAISHLSHAPLLQSFATFKTTVEFFRSLREAPRPGADEVITKQPGECEI